MPPVGSQALPLPYAQIPPRREPRQPMRTSKLGTKLKVLPTQPDEPTIPEEDGEGEDARVALQDEAEGVEFYTPLNQIPAGTARRDAQKLTKSEKRKLPRVTAYCTAASYNLPALQSYINSRPASYRTHPKMFDTECLYTPYLPPASLSTPQALPSTQHPVSPAFTRPNPSSPQIHVTSDHSHSPSHTYSHNQSYSKSKSQEYRSGGPEENLISLDDDVDRHAETVEPKRRPGFSKRPGESGGKRRTVVEVENAEDVERDQPSLANGKGNGNGDDSDDDWEEEESVPDVFLFEYGTVVIWGMTEKEEKAFLKSIKKFEVERLSSEDIEMEDLNFYYADYSRIYNDVITLRKGSSYMTKLSLSHALAQSVKISLFEELISSTIEQTKDIPKTLSETGKIGLPSGDIMKQIGNLFILRININLVGSILDSPEFFWSFPDLEPLYNAARTYLEISQRIDLLNARVEVLQDMLTLLKESVNSSHGERLESVVIFLIGIEIVLGIITILVDLSLS